MKSVTKILALGAVFTLLMATNVQAQCDVSAYTRKCVQFLKPKGFQFLKSYKIDGKNGNRETVRYSYVFSRGTTYLITLANAEQDTKGVKLTLLSPSKQVMTSSYSSVAKKNFPIQLKCQRTGIYYLNFEFDQGSDYCAASVLGFKR
ncbi:MAG: hypothetical protein ACFB0B_17130 [Thermonemataceae bacterium]